MFTGLVETMGSVKSIHRQSAGSELTITAPNIAAEVLFGESVAINGVCLTVVSHDESDMQFQVGPETLRCTNLGELEAGQRVNLERALAVGDRLGGHIVQGHVDGVGTIRSRERSGEWEMVWFHCPPGLARQMVPKGSISVDGVSLTLVDVSVDGFSVALIPHTMEQTTLGFKQRNASVNLETDLFAKYIERYLERVK